MVSRWRADHDVPVLVCYCRAEARRPGLPLAFEWRLRELDEGSLDWAVWMANLMERLDEAGSSLPTQAGPNGAARF